MIQRNNYYYQLIYWFSQQNVLLCFEENINDVLVHILKFD